MFYQSVERLDAAKHAGLGLTSLISFEFAKPANSLPVNGVEFAPAARHYPVIFNSDDEAMPLIVLGVRTKENLLRWQRRGLERGLLHTCVREALSVYSFIANGW